MYVIFQNDEAVCHADNLKEAEGMARSLIKQAKVQNKIKGMSILRPSQYVQIYKFMKEYDK